MVYVIIPKIPTTHYCVKLETKCHISYDFETICIKTSGIKIHYVELYDDIKLDSTTIKLENHASLST